uniref:Secreted protein n=1 Tax=Manihot esculenta TaxID=3983 RepID=A0A251LD21_MANES
MVWLVLLSYWIWTVARAARSLPAGQLTSPSLSQSVYSFWAFVPSLSALSPLPFSFPINLLPSLMTSSLLLLLLLLLLKHGRNRKAFKGES